MKTILALFFCLVICAEAKTRTPPPQPQAPAGVPAAKSAAQKNAELRDWIQGIQKLAQDSEAKATAAEADAAEVRSHLAAVGASLTTANTQLDAAQKAYDGMADERDTAIAQELKDQATIKRFHRLALVLSFLFATAAALYVFEMLKPTGVIGAMFAIAGPVRYWAPVAVFVLVYGSAYVYLTKFF